MRILILSLAIVMIHMTLSGQDLKKDSILSKNHLSFELGGAGILGSINYERLIKMNSSNKLLSRVGLSYVPDVLNNDNGVISLPFGLYYLIGIKHHLELGINNTISWYNFKGNSDKSKFLDMEISTGNSINYYLMPSIGYRYENFYQKSVFFSLAYSPIFYFNRGNLGFNNWAKVGVGFSF